MLLAVAKLKLWQALEFWVYGKIELLTNLKYKKKF